jgi:hypothetical protein
VAARSDEESKIAQTGSGQLSAMAMFRQLSSHSNCRQAPTHDKTYRPNPKGVIVVRATMQAWFG